MDDTRIRQLAEEVLRELRAPAAPTAVRGDLEARVASLEAEVARLRQGRPLPVLAEPPAVHVHVEAGPPSHEHPSHGRLGPGPGSDRCVMEPDKPCVQSGQCRSFGH